MPGNQSNLASRQIDEQALTAIASLGSLNLNNQQRAISFAIAMGNRSHFVFCLTNPCENDGTCFITNSATTKVETRKRDFQGFVLMKENRLCRVYVSATRGTWEIIARTSTIKQWTVSRIIMATARRILVCMEVHVWHLAIFMVTVNVPRTTEDHIVKYPCDHRDARQILGNGRQKLIILERKN